MVSTVDHPIPAGGSGGAGGGPGYAAFISHSHALDGKLAPALQAGLQRFAKPWYRLRALHVFRDDASLSAIQAALEGSEFFSLSPLEVVERLLRRRAITVLDVRSRGRFKAVHLRGARSFPLQELFRAIRTGRVPGRVPIVVDDTGDQAIEAMVALRLTGREAFAMAGGMTSLRRLLAGSLQVPERSPVSGHAVQARALLVGSSAGSALEPADRWSIPAPVGLAAAVLLAAVLYVRARLARRRRRPLVEAFGIIERNQLSYFGHAAGTLQGALGSGRLRRREAAEARFGLAYVRARSGRLRSASEDLDQLIASGHRDPYALRPTP
jgi:rhodanese-related sulfurtransferase